MKLTTFSKCSHWARVVPALGQVDAGEFELDVVIFGALESVFERFRHFRQLAINLDVMVIIDFIMTLGLVKDLIEFPFRNLLDILKNIKSPPEHFLLHLVKAQLELKVVFLAQHFVRRAVQRVVQFSVTFVLEFAELFCSIGTEPFLVLFSLGALFECS